MKHETTDEQSHSHRCSVLAELSISIDWLIDILLACYKWNCVSGCAKQRSAPLGLLFAYYYYRAAHSHQSVSVVV
jgi:hypothetical protein